MTYGRVHVRIGGRMTRIYSHFAVAVFFELLFALIVVQYPSEGATGGITSSASDIVIGDFESADWGAWTAVGTAFKNGPLHGQRIADFGIQGARGNGVATTKIDGDGPIGTLTSPPFSIQRHYITFVVAGGHYEHTTCVDLLIDGQVVKSASGNNSDQLMPVGWDVRPWMGKRAQVRIMDEASGDWGHIDVDHVIQTDYPEALPISTEPLYQERFRPQFHFTARQWTEDKLNPGMREEGWVNDLNGLVYYDGEYHLFAQRWNKCWIHAVSKDLVHWSELQPAFYEESLESGVQSGNAVIDYENTSGLSPSKATPPMVAFWARQDNESVCITYSLDHGRTWTFYAHNPILVHPERDPMVFWYAPGNRWVMMMYGNDQYHILTSKNLIDWTDEHHPIPNSFECPDFFELPLDGNKDHLKWVLIRGNGKYSIGSFDGTQFTEETPQYDSDTGPNFYATQTWGNTSTGDGRRVQAAWMRGGSYPDMPFNQQITFPCVLTLHSTPDGPRLYREPVKEIASLHKHEDDWKNLSILPGSDWNLNEAGGLYQITMDVNIPDGASLTLNVRGIPVVMTNTSFDAGTGQITVPGGLKYVEILIDRTSIELFANHGRISYSRCFLPADSRLSFTAEGDAVTIPSLTVFQLNSAWK